MGRGGTEAALLPSSESESESEDEEEDPDELEDSDRLVVGGAAVRWEGGAGDVYISHR